MGRAPCCWAIGLKKGPWTREEDEILKSFIEKQGHSNWRALPKLAGLLRCGKSCRLRWINYLRPDVKRGNFSKEEDETIIELHATLGNKWSAMAAQLPGRTDNEIKNAWHTRLKKKLSLNAKPPRLHENDISLSSKGQSEEASTLGSPPPPVCEVDSSTAQLQDHPIFPPEHSYSDLSSFLNGEPKDFNKETLGADSSLINSLDSFLELNKSFWSDPISSADEVVPFTATNCDDQMGIWRAEDPDSMISNYGLDFWFDLFVHPEGLELLSNESRV